MEEISLYRKYRPHNFENLVGQDHIKSTLMNAFKGNRVAHAYLFTGPRGTGKTSSARLIAKALNCTNLADGYEPCNECEFCKDINEGRLIDMIEIDAASNRGIDEVRDLKEKINFSPTRSKYKIYIIDEVHMMTDPAFNALLKTLEEPPAHAYFILATTAAYKIPETIISRCQRFDFKRITSKALMTRLSFIAQKEGIEAEDKALEAVSKYVDGGLRDAIGILEQLTMDGKLTFERVQGSLGLSDASLLGKFHEALAGDQTQEALNIVNELHFQGSDLKQFSSELVELLREKMLASVAEDNVGLMVRLIEMIEILQEAERKLDFSIPQLSLEIAVIQITKNLGKNVESAEVRAVAQAAMPVRVEAPVAVKASAEPRSHQGIAPATPVPLSTEKLVLNLDSLKLNWPRIVERIKTPSLRMSIKNAKPVGLEGVVITLEFVTNFHKDKVMEAAHRVEVEETIREVFGQSVKLVAVTKAIEIKSVVGNAVVDSAVVDEALEIFGGEVVG